jgi:putative phosphoesterase
MDDVYSLGIISDTHLTQVSSAFKLAEQLLDGPFAGVDAILHAGDIVIADLESCFAGIPFYAVQGNMDTGSPDLPLKRILKVAGYRIGLIHGWGSPSAVPRNVLKEFSGDDLDMLIFGHSHTPYHAVVGSTLLFNPGSAMDHRGNADSCSVGLVELGRKIYARHIPFEMSI